MKNAWVRPKPGQTAYRRDAAGAGLLLLGAAISFLLYSRTGLYSSSGAPLWLSILAIFLCQAPLAIRRRAPITALLLVAVGFFLCGEYGVPELLFSNIALFLALYTVGAWGQNRSRAVWVRVLLIGGMFIWLVVSLLVATGDEAYDGLSKTGVFSELAAFTAIQVMTNIMYFGAAFYFGSSSWGAARTRAQLRAQAIELDVERRHVAEQAVALDRLTIARELHDVVAHHVSVMGIQAAAARRVLGRSPEIATQSLEVVEQSAETAITELQSLLRTLRDPQATEHESTVGIRQLGVLVASSRASGVPATLTVIGEVRPVPLLVDVAVYRVAQEALTNVRKHAGPGATVELRVRYLRDRLELDVADTGIRQRLAPSSRGASQEAPPTPGGLGLLGMAERLGAVGGGVIAERREQGGFIVRAWAPLPEAPVTWSPATEPSNSAPVPGSAPAEQAPAEQAPAEQAPAEQAPREHLAHPEKERS